MRHFLKPHQYYSILSQHNTNTTMTFQYYLNTTSTLHKRFQYYSILQKRPVNTTSILHCTFWTSILLNTTNTTEVQYYKIINTTQYYQYYQYVWGQLADVLALCSELSDSASERWLSSCPLVRFPRDLSFAIDCMVNNRVTKPVFCGVLPSIVLPSIPSPIS